MEGLLDKKMIRAVDETVDRWEGLKKRHAEGFQGTRTGPTMRDAALVNAIQRLATVNLQRDIWP